MSKVIQLVSRLNLSFLALGLNHCAVSSLTEWWASSSSPLLLFLSQELEVIDTWLKITNISEFMSSLKNEK